MASTQSSSSLNPAQGDNAVYSADRARIEQNLAAAHRSLDRVRDAAERDGDDGLWLDVTQIMVELTRLNENSLRGKARKQIVGQTTLLTGNLVGP